MRAVVRTLQGYDWLLGRPVALVHETQNERGRAALCSPLNQVILSGVLRRQICAQGHFGGSCVL